MIDKVPSGKGLSIVLATVVSFVALAWIVPAHKEPAIRVAFIGNSITFVNDLPRFVEALGGGEDGTIFQDSCLHGALNFMSMLYKGNGMYRKWQTRKAIISRSFTSSSSSSSNGNGSSKSDADNGIIYDFGACSVPQLLVGHDEEFYYENSGKYSDGRNPCTISPQYLAYRESLYYNNNQPEEPLTWDFVVMNDQSRFPTMYEKRKHSLMALRTVYAPLLSAAKATVVFLVTFGYVGQQRIYVDDDASKWNFVPTETEDDMPHFTSALYYGYQEYQNVLEKQNNIPVRLAHVGLAFLTVWEEDRALWRRLFYVDGLHPSPLGTYLEGCVVYATLRQRLPPASIRIQQVSQLWKRARRMHLGRKHYLAYITEQEAAEMIPLDLPTRDEARYLSDVCRRVALKGYRPSSLLSEDELDEEFYSNYPDTDDGSFYDQFDENNNDWNDDDDDSVVADGNVDGEDDDDGWFW